MRSAEELVRDDKVKGCSPEGRESGLFLLRCHQCDVRGAFTAAEVVGGPQCKTCFPVTDYPAVPAKEKRAASVRPDQWMSLRPSTAKQRKICDQFDRGHFDLGEIARWAGCKPAYVEKVFWKNWLAPKLLARIEELEKGRRESA